MSFDSVVDYANTNLGSVRAGMVESGPERTDLASPYCVDFPTLVPATSVNSSFTCIITVI
ncbi:hypothetical protein [Amycolatopsis minnesotensis]|uniref:Uncharacterized protein n=1 Tax=Amycolatopsis minnesotensis TaxID=337894 RepID=A0ABP5DWI9_9PSEU